MKLKLGLVLIAALLTACGSKVVKLYLGGRLPPNEVAVLSADRGNSSGISEIVVRRVNGVDTVRDGVPLIEMLPGNQIVQIELFRRASGNEMESRNFVVVTFNAEAGHAYRARGSIDSGLASAWIVDERDNRVSFTSE